MDSSALGMLLLSRENAATERKTVILVRPAENVRQVLEVANFHKLSTIRWCELRCALSYAAIAVRCRSVPRGRSSHRSASRMRGARLRQAMPTLRRRPLRAMRAVRFRGRQLARQAYDQQAWYGQLNGTEQGQESNIVRRGLQWQCEWQCQPGG